MRAVEPFAYFPDQASAIAGFGGARPPVDPLYCLHTAYVPVQPGLTCFTLRLSDACASRGELTLRVHSYRPDGLAGVTLVAGNRLQLDRLEDGQAGRQIDLPVRFRAVAGVHYALYGFFSEAADLRATAISVMLEEDDASGQAQADAALPEQDSAFAIEAAFTARQKLACSADQPLSLPLSRDCRTDEAQAALVEWPGLSPIDAWTQSLCVHVLRHQGCLQPGATGLLQRENPRLAALLSERGCVVRHGEASDAERFDFLIIDGPPHDAADHPAHYAYLLERCSRLLRGGLAVILTSYHPGAMPGSDRIDRNALCQWALRLIASGYDVAQLRFSEAALLEWDREGVARFAMIVRKV